MSEFQASHSRKGMTGSVSAEHLNLLVHEDKEQVIRRMPGESMNLRIGVVPCAVRWFQQCKTAWDEAAWGHRSCARARAPSVLHRTPFDQTGAP
jgi:hypothetical protein